MKRRNSHTPYTVANAVATNAPRDTVMTSAAAVITDAAIQNIRHIPRVIVIIAMVAAE